MSNRVPVQKAVPLAERRCQWRTVTLDLAIEHASLAIGEKMTFRCLDQLLTLLHTQPDTTELAEH